MSNAEELQEELDDLGGRFRIKKVLGQGSYGLVLKAMDERTKEAVALKRIHKDIMKEKELAVRVLREIKLLQHFDVPNVLHLRHLLLAREDTGLNSLYLVTDVMETDLKSLLSSKQELTIDHVSYLTYQLLQGLQCLHGAGVIHRDLTPGNILVNTKDCELKIADLGLAREIPEDGLMTDYVTVRWYRAPEILCDSTSYGPGVDMWAVGCIFGELLGSKPLFPGTNKLNQLERIMACIGPPTPDSLQDMSVSQKCKEYIRKRPLTPKAPLTARITGPNSTPQTMDLLSKLLVFSPNERLSVGEALLHPVLRERAEDDTVLRVHTAPFTFRVPNRPTTAYAVNEIVRTQVAMAKGIRDGATTSACAAVILITAISKFTRLSYFDIPAKVTLTVDPSQQGVLVQRSGDNMCPRGMLADPTSNFELVAKVSADSKWGGVTAALISFATHELQTVRHKQIASPVVPKLCLRSSFKGHVASKSMDGGFPSTRDLASEDTPGREMCASGRTNPLQSAFSSYKSPGPDTGRRKGSKAGVETPITSSEDDDMKNPSLPSSLPCTPVHTRTRSAGDAIISTALVSPSTSKHHKRINSHLPPVTSLMMTPKTASPVAHQELLNKLVSHGFQNQTPPTDPLKWGNDKLEKLDIARRPAALEELTFECDDEDEPDGVEEVPPAPRKGGGERKVLPRCSLTPGMHVVPQPLELIDARSGVRSLLGVAPSGRGLVYSSVTTSRPVVVREVTIDTAGNMLVMPGVRKGVCLRPDAVKVVGQEVSKMAHLAGIGTDMGKNGQVMNASLTMIRGAMPQAEVTQSFVQVAARNVLNLRNTVLGAHTPVKSILRHSSVLCITLRVYIVSYVFTEQPGGIPVPSTSPRKPTTGHAPDSSISDTSSDCCEGNRERPAQRQAPQDMHEPFESQASSDESDEKCKCGCCIS